MLDRRDLLKAGVAGALGMALTPVSAAVTGKSFRIYMILFRGETPVEQGFIDYFRSRGIAVEFIVRNADRDITRVPEFIREARSLSPDLIYLWGTLVTVAVCGAMGKIDPQKHVVDIPIVYTMVSWPEGAGLIAKRSSSGRNITGVSHLVPMDRQAEAMRAYRTFSSVAVAFNPAEPNSRQSIDELRDIGKREKFNLLEFPVPLDDKKRPVEASLPDLLEAIARRQPNYLYVGPDSFLAANRKVLTETALQLRMPVYSATEVMLRDGKALFGLVSSYKSVGQLAAYKATLILQGRHKPQDIPIETLPSFSYIVNMGVATKLNFYPSLKVMNFAEVLS